LENIVYEFVNAHILPDEFKSEAMLEVQREDILKVIKSEKGKEDMLG
jgi:hypothetical protein